MREEVWVDPSGAVTRYNLAFVHHVLCQSDNGRVLGYDNKHGIHHRHCLGKVEEWPFVKYERTRDRFFKEVGRLRTGAPWSDK